MCATQVTGVHGLRWLGHVVDSLGYMFSPVLACFLLRILQVNTCIQSFGFAAVKRHWLAFRGTHAHVMVSSGGPAEHSKSTSTPFCVRLHWRGKRL